jgi:hypothetical protein
MDDSESWNPEPPPEIVNINKDDLIGDTLFSKHWLFEVLLKLIKVNLGFASFLNRFNRVLITLVYI